MKPETIEKIIEVEKIINLIKSKAKANKKDITKDEAEKMAAELVMFMRKNKDVKVGDEASQAYADGITKYIYDDKLLDALDAETGKTGEDCNSIVAARLKELGVKIH